LPRKFKSYVGLKGATAKLEKWITDFEFVDVGTAIKIIDWRSTSSRVIENIIWQS